MTGRLYISTYGCQMNEYDSDKMADVLRESHGLALTDDPSEADVLLVNTCSIREKAQEKTFSEIGRWKRLKAERPDLVIGVGGCVASQEGDAVIRRAPYVDMVFGPQTLHRLPEMLERVRRAGEPVVDVSFPEIEKFDRLPEPRAEWPTAFVSVMEGCSKYCSFCVVPYTRGEEISRPFDDVIVEVARLAEQGVREVNLLGQNVNAYRGAMHDGSTADLATLIHYVAAVDGIERIRFTTSHPVEFTDSLIRAYAEVPVLALMKRGHTALEYRQKIRRLKEARPGISVSSDFIVGFPGETDADFDATMKLIADVGFDQSFSVIYSARPGTPAASLPDEISADEKKRRLALLQARINQQAAAISEAMVGTVQRVLVERRARRHTGQVAGRTENMRWVNFDGDDALIGDFVEVQITEAMPNSLRGRVVAPPARRRAS